MQVPEKILKKWKALRSPKDAVNIKEEYGLDVSEETINRAMRTGNCNDEVFKAISEYYQEKAEMVKQFL